MKKQTIKILVTSLLLIAIISCEKDEKDTPIITPEEEVVEENSSPSITAQSFDVEENAMLGTLIGKIVAEDVDKDKLTFTMNSIEGIILDPTTGELTTEKGAASILDYETNEKFTFEVAVSDGKSTSRTIITLNIIDIDDGPLTNFEKKIVDGFLVEVLGNSTEFQLFKREGVAKIYYSGDVTSGLRSLTGAGINAYNDLATDGFRIEVVNDSLAANVQLFSGSIEELSNLWSDFGNIAMESDGIGGIAEIGGGRIWVADYAHNKPTVFHEMGHMIGLFHAPATLCGKNDSSENSIMCGGSGAAGEDLTEVDKKIVKYLFHPDITNGMDAEAALEKLEELIIADRE